MIADMLNNLSLAVSKTRNGNVLAPRPKQEPLNDSMNRSDEWSRRVYEEMARRLNQ